MTNTEILRQKIEESGYKLRYIASVLDISYQGFLNKINNHTEFKASEIQALCALLNISNAEKETIFFD